MIGVCGGFQMLGEEIYDPEEIEGSIQSIKGIGLIKMKTTMKKEKVLKKKSCLGDSLLIHLRI